MLVYEEADPETGNSWYGGLANVHPTIDSRRSTAMMLAWPVKAAKMPNTKIPGYNAMSTFWRDDPIRLKKLAAALVNLQYLSDQHVGESMAVFTEGSPESLSSGTGNLISPISMLIGRVARAGTKTKPVGRLEYKYDRRDVSGEVDKSRAVPSLRLAVGVCLSGKVQSLAVSKYGTSRVVASDVAPDGSNSLDVLQGAVTFNEDPDAYARHRRLLEYPVIFGNAVLHDFVSRLTIYDNGDASQNWRRMSPSPDQPLPDLSEIFTAPVLAP